MLKKNFLRNFIIVCLLWLIASGVSLYLSHQQIGQGIKIQIQNYLSLWEDEFYQEQIQSSNKKLQEKIIKQIYWLDSSIVKVSLESDSSCDLQDVFPLRFGIVQMENLYVCYNSQSRWGRAIVSPLFLAVSFIAMVILILMYATSLFYQWQIDKKNLVLQGQKDLIDLSKRVAHDIRSPMSVLNMVSMKLKNQDPEVSELVGQVNTRIQAIAADLLEDVNQRTLEKNAEKKSLQESQVLSVLKEIELKFDLAISYHNFSKRNEWSFRLENQNLLRILSNILTNACESLDKKEKIVGVSISEKDNFFQFEIIDNGCGIEENKLARLWEEGPKDNSKKPKKSHGMALPHARQYLESYDGSISMVSTAGEGTRVIIRVPKND